MLLSLGHPVNRAYYVKGKGVNPFPYCPEISPLSKPRGSGPFWKKPNFAPSEQRSSCLPRLMPPTVSLSKPFLEEDTKMSILKPLFTASVIAISLAGLPGLSWATDQSQQRQQRVTPASKRVRKHDKPSRIVAPPTRKATLHAVRISGRLSRMPVRRVEASSTE